MIAEISFPDSRKSLTDLTKYTGELTTEFNGCIVIQPEDKLDLEVLRAVADKTVAGRVLYLVEMATAESLDAICENGTIVELIERHL